MKDYKHIVPATAYKEEIEKYAAKLRYSNKMFFYNGTYEHGPMYIQTEDTAGRYQWAIVDNDANLVGYISYQVDYFCANAYSFGLIAFADNKMAMMKGIREVIDHLKSLNLHRIEFRCVSDNPAKDRYLKIIKRFNGKDFTMTDVFKDPTGQYHNVDIFEVILC